MNYLPDTKNIIVPYDFTPVSINALATANFFAKLFQKDISILHVLEDEGLKRNTESKLIEVANNNSKTSGINTDYILTPGNIFDAIGQTADANKASLVVMGTHGIKGMQHITGSRALKVITHSKSPFLVVQNKAFTDIKNILVPIDFGIEFKQKLEWATLMGKIFNAKIHILAKHEKDEWLENKVNLNIAFTKHFFQHNQVEVEVYPNENKSDFFKETMRASALTETDLIIILTDPETGITDFLLGPYEQKVIANDAQIPVMCISMADVYKVSGSVFNYVG